MFPLASSVVVLLVAYVNLLLCGHVLATRHQHGSSSFALGPLGVAGLALASALYSMTPVGAGVTTPLAMASGGLSFVGFAIDVWRLLGPLRWRIAGAAAATTGLMLGLALIPDLPSATFNVARWYIVAEVLPWGLVWFVSFGHASAMRSTSLQQREISQRAVLAIASAVATAVVLTALNMLTTSGRIADPLLAVALAAECMIWVYIDRRLISVRVMTSRALVWLLLGVGLVGATTASMHRLGFAVDLTRVLVAVLTTLLVGVGFVLSSEVLSRGVDQLFDPVRERLKRQLSTTQAESAGLRRRLERVERLAVAGELAATVAHEIKNPLAALRGYAELLGALSSEMPDARRPEFDKGLRVIREEADRINDRVQALLHLGRLRPEVSAMTSFAPAQVVAEAVALVEGEAGKVPVTFTAVECPDAIGDADAIRGALVNLLRNALEAQVDQPAARVDVALGSEGETVSIEVRDRGPGLPDAMKHEPFVAFRTTKVGGTGLGLVIARTAAESAGGHLSFSTPQGGGTCATLTLRRTSLQELPRG